jgi:predicted transposase/invertase (TIGR01784 family)
MRLKLETCNKFNKQKSLMEYSEVKNVNDTAFNDGEKAGIKKGEKIGIEKEKKLIAKNMLAMNLDSVIISKATGLTSTEIENLTDENFDDE